MSVNPDYVYNGLWVNWDGGRVSGGRITMGQGTGNILNIFTGIFISFIEGAFWAVVAYAIYQSQTSRRLKWSPPDALHLQKQVILRNSSSDISTSFSMFSLWWNWKSHKIRPSGRTAVIAIIAVVHFLFFVLALPLIYSSFINANDDEVLIRSPYCGFWTDSDTLEQVATSALMTNRTWEAVSYVDQCYYTNAASSLCDDSLVSRQISWRPDWSAGCPFASDICWGGDYYGFSMETDLIDSHKDLGINAPPEDRLFLQRKASCAPLNLTGYTGIIPGNLPGEQQEVYYFGPDHFGDYNYTASVSLYANVSKAGYVLSTFTEYTNNSQLGPRTFTPIPALQRPDGDVTLVFLANDGIAIAGPCEDPFFSAAQSVVEQGTPDNYYRADYPMTVMGCVDQYLIVDQNSHHYANYSSALDLQNQITSNIEKWELSHLQVAAFETIYWAVGNVMGIGGVVQLLEEEALQARKLVVDHLSNPLPKNQWTIEASYWFDISLAQVQRMIVEVATGPPDPTLPGLVNSLPIFDEYTSSGTNYTQIICGSQKVRSLGYTNFNTVGFIIFVALGVAIIMSPSIVIPTVQKFLSPDRQLAWITDGDLQLLRLAHEGRMIGGTWKGANENIPMPENGDPTQVGRLDISNPKHPVIVPRSISVAEGKQPASPPSRPDQSPSQPQPSPSQHTQPMTQANSTMPHRISRRPVPSTNPPSSGPASRPTARGALSPISPQNPASGFPEGPAVV